MNIEEQIITEIIHLLQKDDIDTKYMTRENIIQAFINLQEEDKYGQTNKYIDK